MAENDKEGIILMAIFMLTRDDVLACANEVGIPKEQVTDDVIELVKMRANLGLSHWPEVIKSIVKETIKSPLELVCYPSCAGWEDGNAPSREGLSMN